MENIRKPMKTVSGRRTTDGAGVSLVRVFGHRDVEDFDPFLMLDAFDSTDPADYVKGLPLVSPQGDRDDDLSYQRQDRSRGQPGEQGHHRGRRLPVDDRRLRDHPPGDAEAVRKAARCTALAQPSGEGQVVLPEVQ